MKTHLLFHTLQEVLTQLTEVEIDLPGGWGIFPVLGLMALGHLSLHLPKPLTFEFPLHFKEELEKEIWEELIAQSFAVYP